MSLNEQQKERARQNIRRIAGTFDTPIVEILFAEVLSVNQTDRTCKVKAISGKADTEVENVSLSIDRNDGEIKIPKIGSTVGVAISSDVDAFVFAWSDIEEIIWKGGNYHGLVKVKELTQKINQLEQDNNKLKNAFNAWIVVPNDGGAGLKAAAAPWSGAAITQTQQSEIENIKMRHGDQ
jgi:hypothetical protein